MELRHILDEGMCEILAVSETKLSESFSLSLYKVPNYRAPYRQDRNDKGGGILIYVKECIPHRIIKEHSGCYQLIDYITIELTTRHGIWNLVYIYRPPRVHENVFLKFMSNICETILPKGKLSVFFGDMNFNLCVDNHLGELCEIYGLSNLVKDPTCFKGQTPTLLDVFLTDKPSSFTGYLNCDLGISDFHNFVCVASRAHAPALLKKQIKYRSMKKFSEDLFKSDIETAPFSICDIFDDVNDRVWAHKQMFTTILDFHAPVKSKIICNRHVPHINSSLRKAMYKRNVWRNHHFKNRRDKNARANYVYWRNRVTKLNRSSIRNYFESKCNSSVGSKNFFKTIAPYMNNKTFGNGSDIILHEEGSIISNPNAIANIFNAYYKSIAQYRDVSDGLEMASLPEVIARHSDHPSIGLICKNVSCPSNFSFCTIDPSNVLKCINKLMSNKTPGYDGLHTKFIKISASALCTSLSNIFNECILNNCFPSEMKLSEISPIFKKNDSLLKENYRSINVLTVFSKIFERLISDQLVDFFINILSPNLSAYRKGYSCQHVILSLTEFWRAALDKNDYVGTIATDLSKAFDSMPHGLVIAKLHAYGLSPESCKFLMSYLCGRYQRVKIQSVFSDWAAVDRGVPQGSVLGPLLFNIFINDLFYVDMSSEIKNYADDNNLIANDACLISLTNRLSTDVERAISWFNSNSLGANPDKFQCVIMNRRGTVQASVPVHGGALASTDDIKVLGVTLDTRMTFSPFVSEICKRASRQINALKRISKFLNIQGRLAIYKSFIFSNFIYCPVVWIFCGRKNSDKLEKLQERAIRFVFNDYSTSYDSLLKLANLLPLSIFRLRFLAIEVYKCIKKENPTYLNDLFTSRIPNYNFRDNDLIQQHRFKTVKYGYKSFQYYGAKLWNSLPPEVKNSASLNIFKTRLNTWLYTPQAASLEIV